MPKLRCSYVVRMPVQCAHGAGSILLLLESTVEVLRQCRGPTEVHFGIKPIRVKAPALPLEHLYLVLAIGRHLIAPINGARVVLRNDGCDAAAFEEALYSARWEMDRWLDDIEPPHEPVFAHEFPRKIQSDNCADAPPDNHQRGLVIDVLLFEELIDPIVDGHIDFIANHVVWAEQRGRPILDHRVLELEIDIHGLEKDTTRYTLFLELLLKRLKDNVALSLELSEADHTDRSRCGRVPEPGPSLKLGSATEVESGIASGWGQGTEAYVVLPVKLIDEVSEPLEVSGLHSRGLMPSVVPDDVTERRVPSEVYILEVGECHGIILVAAHVEQGDLDHILGTELVLNALLWPPRGHEQRELKHPLQLGTPLRGKSTELQNHFPAIGETAHPIYWPMLLQEFNASFDRVWHARPDLVRGQSILAEPTAAHTLAHVFRELLMIGWHLMHRTEEGTVHKDILDNVLEIFALTRKECINLHLHDACIYIEAMKAKDLELAIRSTSTISRVGLEASYGGRIRYRALGL
mmetsp:Transcript_27005/g.60827  ORF Transcript_27005/g.60827 Transcript_27005/m.60827 type:complete len:521 (-) Transcript_27005:133-1695(-)